MVDTAPAVRRTLAVALLALVLLTAWLVLGRPGDGEPPRASVEDVAAAPSPVLREPVPQESVQREDEGEAETPSEPSPVADEPAAERRRAADDRAPVGTGSLRVRGLFGGVLWIGRGGSLPLDAPAAAAAAALADGFVRRLGDSPSRAWTVGELAPGPLRVLVADAEGRRFVRDDLWLLAGETLALDAVESPIALLDLIVLAPDGKTVPFARVGLLGDRPGGARDALGFAAASPLGVTDGTGHVRVGVPIGGWRLLVEGGGPTPEVALGLAPYALEGDSRFGAGPRELTIQRAPGAELRGDLLDPDDLGFERRRIAAWSPVGPGPTQREALALGLPVEALATVRLATVGADRRFVLTGLPAHSVLHLRALVDSDLTHGDAFAPLTLARAGERGVEVTQRAGATLELDVVEVGGSGAIADFTAELPGTWPGHPRNGRDGRLVWTDLRPYAAAQDPTFEDLPESGDLALSITADGFDLRLSQPLRLRTGETTRVGPVALRRLPYVHLLVLDALTGEALEDAECELVAIVPEHAVGRTSSRAVSDAHGRARLTVCSDNLADLVVRRRGHAPLRLGAPPPNPAEQPFEVPLAPGATVRARVLDADRVPVRAEVLRRRTRAETGDPFAEDYERALTDADGWVVFHDLEAGAVALAARELPRSDLEAAPPTAASSWVSVGMPQGGSVEVELDALAAHAVGVVLTWEGRALPGAIVRLSADRDAFRAPHADARTFLTGPAVRADAAGLADLGRLHAGVYALRVEHPDVPAFARALLAVGESGVRALELAPDRLRGEVLLDGERVQRGRVVVWAHGAFHEDGLELADGDVLRELVPEPIVLAEVELVGGTFDLAVPPGVELIVTADTGAESGDYFVAVPEGRREPIAVHVERSLELSIATDLRGKRSPTRELGVVGVHRAHPWGRGLFHARFEDGELRVGDLPPGRWHLCLVELAGDQLVLEAGAWRQYDLEGGPQRVRLAWRAP